jgi:glycosyltransferase involved in cell wall biosynthesis
MIVTTEEVPLVSIGLAVYNGEKYLEAAIRSILAQTYTHIELIISDNASTDRTREICIHFAKEDSRIRYSRNLTNIGGANNENLTFKYSKGKYFRWAAHDDLLAPGLVEKCVKVLEANSDVVLCHSVIVVIDEHGSPMRTISRNSAQSSRASQRFNDLANFDQGCEETYGLMRSDILQKTGLQRNYTDSDRTLLAHMSLYGKFYQIPEPLFYKRVHPEMSIQLFPEWRQRMLWFGEEYKSKITLPHWAQFLHYLDVIASSPITASERCLCYVHMLEWIARYRRWRSLGKDVVLAGNGLFRKSMLLATRLLLAKGQEP